MKVELEGGGYEKKKSIENPCETKRKRLWGELGVNQLKTQHKGKKRRNRNGLKKGKRGEVGQGRVRGG